MIFTLSSIHFFISSLNHTPLGYPHLPTISRNTLRPLNTHPLGQESLEEGNEPYLSEKAH
jgi:hypothetical protein